MVLLLLVACLTSQQHATVSQGRICSGNCTCRHIKIQDADQTFDLTQSQYTDIKPTSPSAETITPSAWQGSHWSANFCHWYDLTGKNHHRASGNRTPEEPQGHGGGLKMLPLCQGGGHCLHLFLLPGVVAILSSELFHATAFASLKDMGCVECSCFTKLLGHGMCTMLLLH